MQLSNSAKRSQTLGSRAYKNSAGTNAEDFYGQFWTHIPLFYEDFPVTSGNLECGGTLGRSLRGGRLKLQPTKIKFFPLRHDVPPRGWIWERNLLVALSAPDHSEGWDIVGDTVLENSYADLQGLSKMVAAVSHSWNHVSLSGATVGVD